MSDSPVLDHDAVARAIDRFGAFIASVDAPEALDRVRPFEDRYRSGHYRLVLVGEEKRGKSSLVSALLGTPDLLPSGPEPMTATVFKIVYGEQLSYRIFFLPEKPDEPDTSRCDPIDVSAEEVARYGTESLNPGNRERVDFIAVEHPHPLLAAGLCIIDLPGLGGLKREHGLLTLSYLPNADAAFFVTDSTTSIVTRDEIATLQRLQDFTDEVIFVQTKIDAVSDDLWRSWRRRNLEEIEQRLERKGPIPYFPVSSTLKRDYDRAGDLQDLEQSGFPALIDYLTNTLMPRKYDALALPLLAVIAQETGAAAQPVENELAIVDTQSGEDLKQLEEEIRASSAQYETWRSETLPQIQSGFGAAYYDAEMEARRRIGSALDPSANGRIVGALMNEVIEQDWSAARIDDEAPNLNDAAVAMCAKQLDDIAKTFETTAMTAFEKAAEEIGEATRMVLVERPAISSDRPGRLPINGARGDGWQMFMHGRMGFVMTAMAGKMVAGVVAVLFPPLALAAGVATFLGGLFGARRSIVDANRRERDLARNQLRALLIDTVRRMSGSATFEFDVAAKKNRAAMLDALFATVRRREQDEAAAIAAIRSRGKQTREESIARSRELTAKLALAQAVLAAIRAADQGDPTAAPVAAAA